MQPAASVTRGEKMERWAASMPSQQRSLCPLLAREEVAVWNVIEAGVAPGLLF